MTTMIDQAYEILKSRNAIFSGQEPIVRACLAKFASEPNHTAKSLAAAVEYIHFSDE